MKPKVLKDFLNLALISLYLFGVLACSTTEQSYEGYKQSAINNCASQPTQTEYNNCVERAKISAKEQRINSEKN